jgi:hypothetical protein
LQHLEMSLVSLIHLPACPSANLTGNLGLDAISAKSDA